MTGIDLDQMRSRWQQQGERVDSQLKLDVAAVRATLLARSASAFRSHGRRLIVSLAVDALALLALIAFVVTHLHDAIYLLIALSIGLLVIGETITDVHEWRTIARLNSSAPLTAVQQTFDDLRARRLRMTRWILLLCILMWWPLLALLLKGLFGADLLRWMHWSVAVVNVVAGLVFIPSAALIANWLSRRFGGSPAFQRMLDEMAGKGFDRARQSVQQRARFEQGVADGVADDELATVLQTPIWPATATGPVRALKRRLLLGILVYATLLLATGLFNASHGGIAQFIVPGVVLNFLWVALMATGIEHRVRLSRIALSPSLAAARDSLAQVASMRSAVAQYLVIAAPILSLAMIQVGAKLLFAIDAWTQVGPVTTGVAATIAVIASALLFHRRHRSPSTFATRTIDALCFGTISATRRLIVALAD